MTVVPDDVNFLIHCASTLCLYIVPLHCASTLRNPNLYRAEKNEADEDDDQHKEILTIILGLAVTREVLYLM